jgi:hypothetical protein
VTTGNPGAVHHCFATRPFSKTFRTISEKSQTPILWISDPNLSRSVRFAGQLRLQMQKFPLIKAIGMHVANLEKLIPISPG